MNVVGAGYSAALVTFEGLHKRKDAAAKPAETPRPSESPKQQAQRVGKAEAVAKQVVNALRSVFPGVGKTAKKNGDKNGKPAAVTVATNGHDYLQLDLAMEKPGYVRTQDWARDTRGKLGLPEEADEVASPSIFVVPPSPSASVESPFHTPLVHKPVATEAAMLKASDSTSSLSQLGHGHSTEGSKLRRRDTNVNYQPHWPPGGGVFETLPTLQPLSSADDEFPDPVDSSDSTRSSNTGRPGGAVIDPDTGLVNPRHLRQFAAGLGDTLPKLPDGASPRCQRLHKALVDELEAIGALAAKSSKMPPDQLGLALRDGFARASKAARVLARGLNGGLLPRDREHPRKQAAVAYLGIAGLLNELKRTHLSAAAGHITDAYAEEEMKNLERAAQGILGDVPGSNISTSKGGSLDVNYNGIKGGIGGSSGRVFFKDDPWRDWNFWVTYGGYLKGGYGGALKGWALGVMGKLGFNAGGVYIEQSSAKDTLRIVSNYDANRSLAWSASPRARQVLKWLQKTYVGLARGGLGRNYVPAPGHPAFLKDAKIAKGFNAAKLSLLASMLDTQLGERRFGQLIDAAYPDISDLLGERLAASQQMPLPTRRDVPLSSAGRDQSKPFAFRQEVISVEGKAGKGTPGHSPLEAVAGFLASGTVKRTTFPVESYTPAHRILGAGYHRDFAALLKVIDEIERLGAKAPEQFFLYGKVRQMLGGGKAPRSIELDKQQHLLYGDKIPASLRAAIADPSSGKLDQVTGVIGQLASDYLRFLADAQVVLARPDGLPKPAGETLQRRRAEAFARIRDDVWNGKYSGGMKAALKDPERFVSLSYNAMSLALGRAGVSLSVLKYELGRSEKRDTPANRAAILRADEAYQTVRDLFDGIYLPLKPADVNKHCPLRDKATWQRTDATVKVGVSGGANSNMLNALLSRWHKSITPVSVTNEAGQAVLTADATYQYANKQVNPVRLGHYLQFSFSAVGGAPLTGIAMNKAITQVLEKINGTKLPEERLEASEVMQQLQGLVLDQSNGTKVVVKLHKAPHEPSFDLQYLRVLRVKNSGLNASVSIPIVTPAGLVTFTPGVTHTDSTEGAVMEMWGKSVAYQLMRYPQLGELLQKAGPAGRKAMRKLLDAHPDVKVACFGFPDTLTSTLQHREDYRHARLLARAEGRQMGGKRVLNAFEHYYETEPFARVARVSEQVKSYAPGSTARGANPFDQPRALIDGINTPIPGLEAARKTLAGLKSVDARADFFCSAEGWPLLQAYGAVMEDLCAIKNNAFFHAAKRDLGFQTKLRDKKLVRQGNVTREAIYGAQPKGWWSTLRPNEATARGLPLSKLRILANNPNAKPAVARELRRRSKILRRDVPKPEVSTMLRPFEPAADTSRSPASSTKTSSSLSIFSRAPAFDPRGAGEAVRLLRQLEKWGAEDRSDAGSVQGLAIDDSRPVALSPAQVPRAHAAIGEARDYMNQVSMPATRAWLAKRGIAVVPNGGGSRSIDCLIIALLQHATRDYNGQHTELADECRRYLRSKHRHVGNEMLYPDNKAFVDLVAYINEKLGRNMQVLIATPGPNGHPVMLGTIPTGSPDDRVAVLQGAMHYEALTMVRS